MSKPHEPLSFISDASGVTSGGKDCLKPNRYADTRSSFQKRSIVHG
jgi:hypothetical protein